MRLLVIKLDQIGDFALALPGLRAAYEAGAQIDLVVSPWNLGWKEVIPWINRWWRSELMIGERRRKTFRDHYLALHSLFDLSHELPKQHYDVAVDLRMFEGEWQGKAISWLSRAPVRIGPGGSWLESTQTLIHRPKAIHQEDALRERLSLAIPLSQYSGPLTSLRKEEPSNHPPCVSLYPGTTAAAKSWPIAHWQKLIVLLKDAVLPSTVVQIVGSPNDQSLISTISSACPSTCTLSPKGISEFLASVNSSDLIISLDSAAQHLARLQEVPRITLFSGITSPDQWASRGNNRIFYFPQPCTPCYRSTCPLSGHDCMTGITPEQVFTATVDALRQIRPDALR